MLIVRLSISSNSLKSRQEELYVQFQSYYWRTTEPVHTFVQCEEFCDGTGTCEVLINITFLQLKNNSTAPLFVAQKAVWAFVAENVPSAKVHGSKYHTNTEELHPISFILEKRTSNSTERSFLRMHSGSRVYSKSLLSTCMSCIHVTEPLVYKSNKETCKSTSQQAAGTNVRVRMFSDGK